MKSTILILLLIFSSFLVAQITIMGDHNICKGQDILLYVEDEGAGYQWIVTGEPDSVLSAQYWLAVSPEATTSYTVYDSTDTSSVTVYVTDTDCLCRYYIPNFFSPDGDISNEYFIPVINCDHIGLHMSIYSRGQEMVYDSHELYQKWDGTHYKTGIPQQDGIYVYQVSFMKPDGEIVQLIGFVILAR